MGDIWLKSKTRVLGISQNIWLWKMSIFYQFLEESPISFFLYLFNWWCDQMVGLVQENNGKLQVFFAISRNSWPVDRRKHKLRSFPEKGCMTKNCTAKRKRWVGMERNSTADEEDDIWCINCFINLYKRRQSTLPICNRSLWFDHL